MDALEPSDASLPAVLVVHIKRFQYSAYSREKLTTRVGFPLRGLDMSPYLSHPEDATGGAGSTAAPGPAGGKTPGKAVYDLFGVSNHMGSLGGGHYTANCLRPGGSDADDGAGSGGGGGWYNYNDATVTPLGTDAEAEIQGPSAYVLFYRQRR